MQRNVAVVIRSCGERTESHCRDIVRRQVPEDSISTIWEVPFVEAVRRTYVIGVEAGLKWTLAVDADILLTSTAIEQMVRAAEQKPLHTFVYQGCVLDKLFNGIRPGGPHLYRTELLPLALRQIEDFPNNFRPESHTYSKMAEKGFHFYQERRIYGLHDYEQYFRDTLRKSFVHAKKHPHLTEQFMRIWAKSPDPDHAVAITGFIKGLAYEAPIAIDHDFFSKVIPEKVDGHVEKPALVSLPVDFVAKIVSDFLEENTTALSRVQLRESTVVFKMRLSSKLLWHAGKMIEQIGRLLKQKASQTVSP